MTTNSSDEFKEIMSRVKRAEQYTRGWHQNIERWRQLYDMKHYKGQLRPREVRYSDPTFTNTVDLAVGIMLGNDLRWHAFGFSPSKKEQESTGKIEKLVNGTLEVNSEREESHQLYHLFLNFCRDGGGIIYSVFDPELADASRTAVTLPDENSPVGVSAKNKFYEVPIRCMVVDPSRFICLPGGPRRWLMMGIKEQRSVLDVEIAYGVTIDKYRGLGEEQKSSIKGTFYNVWDYTWVDADEGRLQAIRNVVVFEGQNVRGPDIMEGYDELPFTVQFFKPVGEDSAQWHNIMTPLESSVSFLERSFNRRAYQIEVFTGLPLVIKTQPGRRVQIDPGLYNSVEISPDEGIEFPTWPGTAPDVQMQIDFLRSRVQQSGFSDVMFGSGQNQIAGYAVSQLGDQNRIRLEQPIQHLELLLSTWAKKTLRLLEYFAQGSIICVYGTQKGLDYKDEVDMGELEGFSVRAEIRPSFPNEQARKVAMSTQTKGTLSDYTRMERYLDVQQPEDEERRKIIEATVRHPIALQYAIMAELKSMADAGDEIAMMTLQSIQNEGIAGMAGRPKEGNKPEQMVAGPSPSGQPTPQESGGVPPGQSELEQQEALANEAPGLM